MPGFRLGSVGWLIPVGIVLAAATTELDTGRQLYQTGNGSDPIEMSMFALPVDSEKSLFTCAACHGEDGTGGSEGGVVAPSLTKAADMSSGDAAQWLKRSLQGDGGRIADTMPRYRLSDRDLTALTDYVRTFPNPPVTGVMPDTIAVAVEVDGSGLGTAGKARLERELTSLASQANDGGVFGRRIMISIEEEGLPSLPVFARISWFPSQNEAALIPLSIRPEDTSGVSRKTCASFQPPVNSQLGALIGILNGASGGLMITSDGDPGSRTLLESSGALSLLGQQASGENAVKPKRIHVGQPEAELDGNSQSELYLFADLIGQRAADHRLGSAHIIVPMALENQMSAVTELRNGGHIDARSAGIIVVLVEATRNLIAEMARSGRKLKPLSLCETMDKRFRQQWAISEIHGQSIRELPAHFP
ncbi:MAG: cytochrome c [Allopontixanthobacter sediminis]